MLPYYFLQQFELILVDNGSTDKSGCICDDHVQEDAFIMCNLWAGDEENNKKVTIQIDKPDLNRIPLNECEDIVFFTYVWNKIYSTEIIRKHRIYFDESIDFDEDYRFNLNYAKYCTRGVVIPQQLCVHLYHEEGLATKGFAAKGRNFSDINLSKMGYLVRIEKR